MKNKLFKTLAIFGLSFIAWNCSDDPSSSPEHTSEIPANQPKPAFEVDINCWMLNVGSQTLLIVPDGIGTYTVTDPFSVPYGTYDVATGTIYDANHNTVITNIDVKTLPILSTDKTVTFLDGTKMGIVNGELVPLSSGITVSSSSVTPGTSAGVIASSSSAYIPGTGNIASSSSVYNPGTPAVSSSSTKTPTPVVSSSSQKVEQPAASSSSASAALTLSPAPGAGTERARISARISASLRFMHYSSQKDQIILCYNSTSYNSTASIST